MKFVDEIPGKKRETTLNAEVEEIVAQLMDNPGKPALIWDGLSASNASQRALKLRNLGLEAVSRTVDGTGAVYAQYVAPESE